MQPLVPAAVVDRERYAERQSWTLLALAIVFGCGSVATFLLFGDSDPLFALLAIVALVGAAVWWQRGQGGDE